MTTVQFPNDTALINVDVQVDFCPGGALAVVNGDEIVPYINAIKKHFRLRVYTQDWHPEGHASFASSHPGAAVFSQIEMPYGPQILWPDHCVQGTTGANFHPDLEVGQNDLILQKGTNPQIDSYSGFFENDDKTQPRFPNGKTLTDTLRNSGIKRVVLTGLAYDYCVGWHALDARYEGFEVIVVRDATRSIAAESEQEMDEKLAAAGVKVIQSVELAAALAPASTSTSPQNPKDGPV